MKNTLLIFLIYFSNINHIISQQVSELKKGLNLIQTNNYSEEEDKRILKLFEGLRVADVSDGMDMVGLPSKGLVDPSIHPAWIDPVDLTHQVRGIAITARYVPTQKPDRPACNEDFSNWEGNFYNKYSSEAFIQLIKPGTVVVIDDVEDKDIGSIGSFNILEWYRRGAVGVITDASARDLDEITLEKVPLYFRKPGRGIRPGRNELESVNRPIVIGGVLVCPGDIIVADKDGVCVVPRYVAERVAKYAREILNKDKEGRRKLYESLKMNLDKTVK